MIGINDDRGFRSDPVAMKDFSAPAAGAGIVETPLSAEIAFLRGIGGGRQVEERETHMSHVFLTRDRVYKLKKPVRFPYLDFSTLLGRERAARAEAEINRRLAPDVYLGAVALTLGHAGLALDGDGPVIDRVVVMRRLDEADTLEAAIRAGRLEHAALARLADLLADFYTHARRVHRTPAAHLLARRRALATDLAVLTDPRFALPQGLVGFVARVQRRFLAERGAVVARRLVEGRLVDAHGDLRPEHVWLAPRPMIIDRLEFDPALRALDQIGRAHV
jgi:aminoglycoside phosphotransferase family enzyme